MSTHFNFKGSVPIILITIIFIFILAVLISIYLLTRSTNLNPDLEDNSFTYGVTFTPKTAQYLSGDWKKVYKEVLDDLKVRNLRIPSYWSEIEPIEGNFDFSQTDYLIDEAGKRNAKLILALGVKQPRWPECHIPDWAYELSVAERQQKALERIKKTIERYKTNPNIIAWQVENEPLFWFGDGCDDPDLEFLKQEVDLVSQLDPERDIIISDTGEWQFWKDTSSLSDILGISLYRKVFNPIFGYIYYPFPPEFYFLKSNFIKPIFAPNNKKTIITELQAEPWLKAGFKDTPAKIQTEFFSTDELANNLGFAQQTGFKEIYFWGVEWWYYMKEKGFPGYWDFAKKVFNP